MRRVVVTEYMSLDGVFEEPGQDILVAGSGRLVQTLLEHGLVDELRLMVHPIVLGSGKRLFHDRAVFNLVDTKRFSSGIVVLTYEPRPAEDQETQSQQTEGEKQ